MSCSPPKLSRLVGSSSLSSGSVSESSLKFGIDVPTIWVLDGGLSGPSTLTSGADEPGIGEALGEAEPLAVLERDFTVCCRDLRESSSYKRDCSQAVEDDKSGMSLE